MPVADGLHEQGKPLFAMRQGGINQPEILFAGQLAPVLAEQPPLQLQSIDPAALPAHAVKKAVECNQHGIDGRRAVSLLLQMLLPFRCSFMTDIPRAQPGDE